MRENNALQQDDNVMKLFFSYFYQLFKLHPFIVQVCGSKNNPLVSVGHLVYIIFAHSKSLEGGEAKKILIKILSDLGFHST